MCGATEEGTKRWRGGGLATSSSGMVPSWRYLEIGLRQFVAGLGGSIIAATSPSGPGIGLISPTEGHGSAFDVGTGSSSPDGAPGTDIKSSASGEVPGIGFTISSSSRMEGLNKSWVNTPGGGRSQLDPNRVMTSVAPLSHRRMWWSSKLSNFSSSLPTSCWYAAIRESRQLDSPIT
jgi:hypothetical protein